MKTFKLVVVVLVVLSLAGVALAQSAPECYKQGIKAHKNGHYDQAIAHYNKALELNPTYMEAYLNRGIASSRQGHPDEAIADFNKVLELNPGYAKAYFNRALAFCMKKDYDQAWEDVHKAQSLGYIVNPDFLQKLRLASGRSK
jgi:tetratricopeptide (TPR) repeat protein